MDPEWHWDESNQRTKSRRGSLPPRLNATGFALSPERYASTTPFGPQRHRFRQHTLKPEVCRPPVYHLYSKHQTGPERQSRTRGSIASVVNLSRSPQDEVMAAVGALEMSKEVGMIQE
ncbi:hypothetical protein FRB97_003890, partial [Tulasnella sp. 331]